MYPVSYMSSQLGMTALLVGLGLAGQPELAAEVGIVQGALLAIFYAFSGNVRSLIFREERSTSTRPLLLARLLLTIPLGISAYLLGVYLGGVGGEIALVLTLRKMGEWFSEIHLSEAERDGDLHFSLAHLLAQSALLIAALVWLSLEWAGAMAVLLAWAVLPPLLSLRHLRNVMSGSRGIHLPVKLLLPHIGSTMVQGVTVYVFRLTLLLLVGKRQAGDLYTAFAIGGLLGSVFATAVGPSMVLRERRTGRRHFPVWIQITLAVGAIIGAVLAVLSSGWPGGWFSKSGFFWQAVGLSLIGGVVMVLAQRDRLRILQTSKADDVFAPDVVANVLIVAILPFFYYLSGPDWLVAAYLMNAVLGMIIYRAAVRARGDCDFAGLRLRSALAAGLVAILFAPIFIQMDGGLFRDSRWLYDAQGVLSRLPVPLSVFACFGGLVLIGKFIRANLALAIIFLSFVAMVVSTATTASGDSLAEQTKLILLMQYILPMFGLALGMMYQRPQENEYVFEKTIVIVLSVLLPAQLLATWGQGHLLLTPHLYLFSVYQHLEYVPVIMASGYLLALFSLWNLSIWRTLLIVMAPLLGIYMVAAGSILATGLSLGGGVIFALQRMLLDKTGIVRAAHWAVVSLLLSAGVLYYVVVSDQISAADLWLYTKQYISPDAVNVDRQLDSWRFHKDGILSGSMAFVFGHSAPPDRSVWASAHNYYLDFIYNFGVVGALLVICLALYTLYLAYQHRDRFRSSPAMMGLLVVVSYLLFVDNSFKVGLRQPYPGIATYFLWGLLLAQMGEWQIRRHRGLRA